MRDEMKAIGFNCSPRAEGNTAQMIKAVFSELEKEGIKTELIQVGGKDIRGCKACGACRKNQDRKCVFGKDGINEYIEKMAAADIIIIGSPTYFADLTTEAKALIDRCGYVGKGNGGLFKRKIGAAVVSMRRAGAVNVFDSINHFFTISEMVVPGSSYWNLSMGDFANDVEGTGTMKTLGANIAWLANKLK